MYNVFAAGESTYPPACYNRVGQVKDLKNMSFSVMNEVKLFGVTISNYIQRVYTLYNSKLLPVWW